MSSFRRRDLLKGTALVLAGSLPWHSGATTAPHQDDTAPGRWKFFTAAEAAVIEAIADRFIPPDPQTLGGKDAGCAVFIDRQLAGPYGQRERLYTAAPYQKGEKQQGPQSAIGPAELYRKGLAALDEYVRTQRHGTSFAALDANQQDDILNGLDEGKARPLAQHRD
jgi:gluconate 2-dehydrogenase gamma chain